MATMTTPKASESLALGNIAWPTPANSKAMRIEGNDSITSQTRMINASRRPPT